ncbi:MAG TPA: RNA 2',3'-cyclic phosphodiesterase [Dongiaceae bacterium]|jgi:2'-5' RNA ligase|nr:RNA 2',3'-cyclic phosphodiesterase [Dongiaceae bacterium]
MRLFIALELPDAVRRQLATLSGGLPGMHWTPSENYHLTLRFLGETDRQAADDIDAMLAGVHAPAFSLTLQGIDCFAAGNRIRTLWAGTSREPGLQHLRDKIESACVRSGLAPDGHRFTPHVSLGRARDPLPRSKLQEYLVQHGLFKTQPFAVTEFTLFASMLGGTHAVYRVLRRYSLVQRPAEVHL